MTKPYHIAKFSTPRGYRGIYYLFLFNGDPKTGKHHFVNHNHARNFVRYLFSQSKAHPANKLTNRNFFLDYGDKSGTVKEGYVDDPKRLLNSFLQRSFPKSAADRHFFDDGCYPFFIQQVKDGPIVSNFASKSGNAMHFRSKQCAVLRQVLGEYGVDWGKEVDDIKRFAGNRTVIKLDSLTDAKERQKHEALLHAVTRKVMGDADRVVLTVSHRDQPDHNPLYHIHRLVRTSDESPAPDM
jgi:hypothetical protein